MRVKCPKCHYLGFETGDRCKHCGYDFSLLSLADPPPPADDLLLHTSPDRGAAPAQGAWPDLEIDPGKGASLPAEATPPHALLATLAAATPNVDTAPISTIETAVTAAGPARPGHGDPGLPLFPRPSRADEPRVRMPPAPRPPVAVRRTPETPRLKTPFSAVRPFEESEPALEFPETPAPRSPIVVPSPRTRAAAPAARLELSGATARGAAAVIDIAMLASIDLAVLYFTMAMAGLPMRDWRVLPLAPLLAFLILLKFAYYAAFTAFGGQTIGKMAAHIRVVADDGSYLDPAQAVQRTVAALGSVLTLGAGFVPALVSPNRLALHDRVAHTRVVALPST